MGAPSNLGRAPSLDKPNQLASLPVNSAIPTAIQRSAAPAASSAEAKLSSNAGSLVTSAASLRHAPAELAMDKRNIAQPSISPLSGQPPSSMFAISPKKRQNPSPAKPASARQNPLLIEAASAKQSPAASPRPTANQLVNNPSAASPRTRRDPSPAELALAKQAATASSSGVTLATSSGHSPAAVKLSRDGSPAQAVGLSTADEDSPRSGGRQPDGAVFALSPRQKRDPSPAELGLARHLSGGSQVAAFMYTHPGAVFCVS